MENSLGCFQTNLPSYEANALSVCQPGWYDNGVLGFQNQTWGGYAAYDFSAEKLAGFSGKPILKDGVVLLYRAEYNNDSEIYTYEWIEGQQSLYQTSSTRTLSSLTEENADGELISLDASRKTASIRFGNIQHDIDFLSGTVEESYIIDENQLTRGKSDPSPARTAAMRSIALHTLQEETDGPTNSFAGIAFPDRFSSWAFSLL